LLGRAKETFGQHSAIVKDAINNRLKPSLKVG